MSARDNGGPAFPVYDHHGNGQQFLAGLGMSLRDYLAAKAFQVRLSQAEARDWTLTEVCEQSWADADAMLKARGNAGKCVEPECPYYGQPCVSGCLCAKNT